MFSANRAGVDIGNCQRYVRMMEKLADRLLKEVNTLTGTVVTYEPNANIEATDASAEATVIKPSANVKASAVSPQSDGLAIDTSAYRKPSWMSEPAYVRRLNDDGLGTINRYVCDYDVASVALSSDPGSWSGSSNPKSYPDFNKLHGDGGGSWFGASSSSASSGFGDGGGSWDSSSSSSDSSSSSSDSSSSGSDSGSSGDGGGSW